MNKIVTSTYRRLLKHGQKIDNDPAMRAMLAASMCSVYDRQLGDWVPVNGSKEWHDSRKIVDSMIREMNKQKEWYLPEPPAASRPAGSEGAAGTDGAGSGRRTRLLEPGVEIVDGYRAELQTLLRTKFRTTAMSTENLNVAFAAVKTATFVIQAGQDLPASPKFTVPPEYIGSFQQQPGSKLLYIPQPDLVKTSSGRARRKSAKSKKSNKDAEEEEAVVAKPSATIDEDVSVLTKDDAVATEQLRREVADGASADAFQQGESQQASSDSGLLDPSRGCQLLIAHPLLPGFFRHSIIFVTRCHPVEGAMGIIINKPLLNEEGVLVPVWAAIPNRFHPLFSKHLSQNPVMIGGPVATASSSEQTLFVIHRIPNISGTLEIGPGIFMSGDMDEITAALDEKRASAKDMMVVLGYSGWGQQQLEGEVTHGSWGVLVHSKDPSDSKSSGGVTPSDFIFAQNDLTNSGTCKISEPEASWVKVFSSIGPQHAKMTRLLDVQLDTTLVE